MDVRVIDRDDADVVTSPIGFGRPSAIHAMGRLWPEIERIAHVARQRPDRMDQELQQQVWTDRAPDQRQREFEQLRDRAETRVVLEAGARQPRPLHRIVQDDPVVFGDDEDGHVRSPWLRS